MSFQIPQLTIRNIALDNPLVLAPMAGYTDLPFRLLCRRFGCALTFTEMITVEGIARDCPKTRFYLESTPEERPVAAHLYGHEPEVFGVAAEKVAAMDRFDLIDINCGCPKRKINRRGAGVSLMKEPEKIKRIVELVFAASHLPVTVKTRIGLTESFSNVSEVAHAAEEGGAAAVIVHARYASDVHSGPLHWNVLARLKQERAIPVIGNGGVTDAETASRMLRETGVDGVMIARAAVGYPWIFREILSAWEGKPCPPPSLEELRALILEHIQMLWRHFEVESTYRKRRHKTAEQAAVRKFVAYLVHYMTGMHGLRGMLHKLEKIGSIQDTMAAVDEVLESQLQYDTHLRRRMG